MPMTVAGRTRHHPNSAHELKRARPRGVCQQTKPTLNSRLRDNCVRPARANRSDVIGPSPNAKKAAHATFLISGAAARRLFDRFRLPAAGLWERVVEGEGEPVASPCERPTSQARANTKKSRLRELWPTTRVANVAVPSHSVSSSWRAGAWPGTQRYTSTALPPRCSTPSSRAVALRREQ
jgi:hypothetical protein